MRQRSLNAFLQVLSSPTIQVSILEGAQCHWVWERGEYCLSCLDFLQTYVQLQSNSRLNTNNDKRPPLF